MTDEQIQISKDSELMGQVISLIASYAVENDMSPNETIKTVSENMLGLLKIVTFENWEKKTLPSVISTSDDCVSRQAVLDMATTIQTDDYSGNEILDVVEVEDIKALPPVTPTHGMCKDCTKSKILNGFEGYSIVCSRFGRMAVNPDFYCADFEKRGNENGSN